MTALVCGVTLQAGVLFGLHVMQVAGTGPWQQRWLGQHCAPRHALCCSTTACPTTL